MARKISMKQAINEALDQEMARDPRVIVMGEDIVGGMGGDRRAGRLGRGARRHQGALRASIGDRLMDTPLSESRLYRRGHRCGRLRHAAGGGADVHRLHGRLLRPDLQPGRQVQIHVRRQGETPVVIRAMVGAGFRAAAQHSQMLTPLFTHIPGLKVVCPSNAYDAKGLLIQSIRDNDPVIFCEHKNLYGHEIRCAGGVLCRSPSARRTSCATARM